MLDYIGLSKKMGVDSAAQLFDTHSELVHYTSALRYPVFRKDLNYNGTPSMTSHRLLKWQLDINLTEEIGILGANTVYVPLGPKVEEAFDYIAESDKIKPDQVLNGMPHPSGANAERIAFFLDEKQESQLSNRTNPEKITQSKQLLLKKVKNI